MTVLPGGSIEKLLADQAIGGIPPEVKVLAVFVGQRQQSTVGVDLVAKRASLRVAGLEQDTTGIEAVRGDTTSGVDRLRQPSCLIVAITFTGTVWPCHAKQKAIAVVLEVGTFAQRIGH
ncbi:hypothetical protein D3C81_1835330 [compost metagenome]